jgi:hypothetical protein
MPSKEEFGGNLKNHMEGTNHAKAFEDVLSKKGIVALFLFIGQKGKPSTSSKGVSRNQGNLY